MKLLDALKVSQVEYTLEPGNDSEKSAQGAQLQYKPGKFITAYISSYLSEKPEIHVPSHHIRMSPIDMVAFKA